MSPSPRDSMSGNLTRKGKGRAKAASPTLLATVTSGAGRGTPSMGPESTFFTVGRSMTACFKGEPRRGRAHTSTSREEQPTRASGRPIKRTVMGSFKARKSTMKGSGEGAAKTETAILSINLRDSHTSGSTGQTRKREGAGSYLAMAVCTRASSAGTSPTGRAPSSLSTRIATGADSRGGSGRAKGPTILARVRSSKGIGTGTARWRGSSRFLTGMFFGGSSGTTSAARASTGTRMGIHMKGAGLTISNMEREFSN